MSIVDQFYQEDLAVPVKTHREMIKRCFRLAYLLKGKAALSLVYQKEPNISLPSKGNQWEILENHAWLSPSGLIALPGAKKDALLVCLVEEDSILEIEVLNKWFFQDIPVFLSVLSEKSEAVHGGVVTEPVGFLYHDIFHATNNYRFFKEHRKAYDALKSLWKAHPEDSLVQSGIFFLWHEYFYFVSCEVKEGGRFAFDRSMIKKWCEAMFTYMRISSKKSLPLTSLFQQRPF